MDVVHIHGDLTTAEAQVAALARKLGVGCVHSSAGDDAVHVDAVEARYAGTLEGADLAIEASKRAASA